MKKIKLLTTLSVGLTVATPLIVMTSCGNKFKDNVVWETKTQKTEEGKKTVTFTYTCKIVGDNDEISVKIKSQTGIKSLDIESQKFDIASKTGTVTFVMTVENENISAQSNFDITVSSTKGNIWSQDITGLIAIYTPITTVVPITALDFDKSSGYIKGLKSEINTDLTKCTKLFIPAKIDDVEVQGISSTAFKDVCKTGSGTLENVCEIEFDKDSTISTIKDSAFENCSSLTKPLIIPKTVTGIWTAAFMGTKISSLTIEEGDKTLYISNDCFKGVPLTGNLSIPARTAEIGRDAFNGCTSLNGMLTVTPSTKLCKGVFQGCTAIGSLNLEAFTEVPSSDLWAKPDSNNGCFENICNQSRQIPLILQNYETQFMEDMTTEIKKCSSVELSFKTEAITSSSDFTYNSTGYITGFVGTPAAKILYIPKWYKDGEDIKAVKGVATSAFYDTAVEKTLIPSTMTCLAFADNASYNMIGSKAFCKAQFTEQLASIGGLYIPNSITTIGVSAFEGASFGTISSSNKCALYLPNKLTTVGDKAFKCGICLPASFIPTTIRTVGEEAFAGCYLLENKATFPIEMWIDAEVKSKAFAFADSSILGHTVGPTLDFTQMKVVPQWTGTQIFGSSTSLSPSNKITISLFDLVADQSGNAWDQYELMQNFKTFVTTTGGLTDTTLEFNPSLAKYPVSLFKTYTSSTPITYLAGFATYGNGKVINSEYLKLFTKREMYMEEVNLITIETLIPFTSIADEALAYVEGEQCINFADNNIEAIEIPNTVTSIGKNFLNGQKSIKNIDMHTFDDEQFDTGLFTSDTFAGLNDTDACVLWAGTGLTPYQCQQLEFRLKNAYGLPANWSVDTF